MELLTKLHCIIEPCLWVKFETLASLLACCQSPIKLDRMENKENILTFVKTVYANYRQLLLCFLERNCA